MPACAAVATRLRAAPPFGFPAPSGRKSRDVSQKMRTFACGKNLMRMNKQGFLLTLLLPALGLLTVACGRRTPAAPAGAAADGPATERRAAPAATSTGVMQDATLARTVPEMRRDSLCLLRIDSLARCRKPSFDTPRHAVEAHMRAYVAVDAPLLFHVCELIVERPRPQQVLDYQVMMEGLQRRGLQPVAFTVTHVHEPEGDVCPVDVDLTMPDGTLQALRAEALRLPSGRWRPLMK